MKYEKLRERWSIWGLRSLPAAGGSLADPLTTTELSLDIHQDTYLAQSQLAQDQQTTQHLIADLNATLADNPEGFREAMHTAFGGKASE